MKRINRKNKGMAVLLTVVMLFGCLIAVDGLIGGGLFSVRAAANDISQIRVYLTTMSNNNAPSNVNFTVHGKYSITGISGEDSFRNGVLLREGVNYSLRAEDKTIILKSPDGEFTLGDSVTFYSHLAGRNYYLSVQNNPSYGACNYIGNMSVFIETSGKLSFINKLQLDDYLCGVVAHEMSNGQAVESLKVQAVCARSYAYRILSASQSKKYDLVDTTENQVYKGYRAYNDRVIKAVDETAYQILTYKGNCIATYYSSSNGGVTEHNGNAWGSTKLAYLNVNVDPYDTAYQDVEYVISKTSMIAQNVKSFKKQIQTEVANAGYDIESLEIVSINSITPTYLSEPASLPENERRVYSLAFGLTVKAKKNGSSEYTTFNQTATFTREKARTSIYGVRSGSVKVLNSTKIKVYETSDSFKLIVDGYGHGIGMSQHGTYGRVAAGQTYSEILQFYFNNTAIKTLQFESYIFEPAPSNEYIDSQATSVVSVEPSKIGTVTENISLYSKAGALFERIAEVETGKGVTIIAETPDWYKVIVGDNENTGFIMKKYVHVEDEIIIENVIGMHELGVTVADVSVRSSPEFSDENIIGTLPANTEVAVIAVSDTFFEIIYNEARAYVAITEVNLSGKRSYAAFNADVTAFRAPIFKFADDTKEKLGFYSENTQISVFDIGRTDGYLQCIYNGGYGYIKTSDVMRHSSTTGYIIPEIDRVVSISLKVNEDSKLYSSDTLADETVIFDILAGDVIKAVEYFENIGVYKVVFGTQTAYVAAQSVKVYSKSVECVIATAKTDVVLYTDLACTTVATKLKQGENATVIGENGNVVMLRYGSGIYYARRSELVMRHQEIYIFD